MTERHQSQVSGYWCATLRLLHSASNPTLSTSISGGRWPADAPKFGKPGGDPPGFRLAVR
jgi:hypothetical protein